MEYLNNITYVFIPFTFNELCGFRELVETIDKSRAWKTSQDEIKYMFKYVADKIKNDDKSKCQCFHYVLEERARKQIDNGLYSTLPVKYKGKDEIFKFRILDAHLYCFSTTVGILAFKVHFDENEPLRISAAQYYLKKVSSQVFLEEGRDDRRHTFLALAKMLTGEFDKNKKLDFFYYSNDGRERSNMFTYLEVEPQDSYDMELFYLRNCYHDGFIYSKDEKRDSEEIYSPSVDQFWGLSSEAAVCLACPKMGRKDFLTGRFFTNFNAQYLFMYVLLLHQKYVLYMFLTRIGVGMYNDLEKLEEYRNQLYEFETDFVFSCVTEVPQYQNLYERMTNVFSLKKMYEDVHEPILSLSEIRREASENEQKRQANNVDKALFVLAVLGFFSALIDSFDFASSFFGWFFDDIGIKIVQVIFIAVILVTAIYVFVSVKKSKKK